MEFKTAQGIETNIRIDGKIIKVTNSANKTTAIYKKAVELQKRMEKSKAEGEMSKEDIDFFLSLAKDIFGEDYELVSQLELQDFTKVLDTGVQTIIDNAKNSSKNFEAK